MGQAIPRQHPAVVLRSHFNQLRALLAVAMVAVIGLTVAVVILATEGDEVGVTSSAERVEGIRYGGFNSATGRPESAPLPQQDQAFPGLPRGTAAAQDRGLRYDGGPEEGTSGVLSRQPSVTPETEVKDEASIAAAVGQATSGNELRGSKASDFGTSQYRLPAEPRGDAMKDYSKNSATGDSSARAPQPTGSRYDGGPEEGTAVRGLRP
jgi:hypothetical protein